VLLEVVVRGVASRGVGLREVALLGTATRRLWAVGGDPPRLFLLGDERFMPMSLQ